MGWQDEIVRQFVPRAAAKREQVKQALEMRRRHRQDNRAKPKGVANNKCVRLGSADSFGNALEERGFERLGRGCFSTVYGKPGYDRVIKVTHRLDTWVDFAQWAGRVGFAGKYAPRVFSFKEIKGKFATFYVSVVERLDRTLWSVGREEDARVAHDLANSYLSYDNTLAGCLLEDIQPGMASFLQGLKTRFGGGLDLHGENWMVRKDGTLVLNDPVTCQGTLITRRLRAGDFSPVPYFH